MADLDRYYAYARSVPARCQATGALWRLWPATVPSAGCRPLAFDAASAFALFVGVFPQSLSRLALIGVACALAAPLGHDRQLNVMIAERR